MDEVGLYDQLFSYDAAGSIFRKIVTGQVYSDPVSRLMRSNVQRLVLDTDVSVDNYLVTITAGDDYTGASWLVNRTYPGSHGGAKPIWVNISGQWHQISINLTTTGTLPAKVRNISWLAADMGEFV